MVIGFVDIVLSWFRFNVVRKLGFGKLSFFAPYIFTFKGAALTNVGLINLKL